MNQADGGSGVPEASADRRADAFIHELNNILCVINNHASLVMDEFAPQDQNYASMVEIKAAVRRCTELADLFLAASESQLPVGGARLGTDGETVLVVEPEQKMLDAAATVLIRGGYMVLLAKTADAACRLAAEHAGEIHLLVAAGYLPELSGHELRVKIMALRPDIGTILICGQAAGKSARVVVNDDRVPQLAKPFTAEAFLRKIRTVLDGKRGQA